MVLETFLPPMVKYKYFSRIKMRYKLDCFLSLFSLRSVEFFDSLRVGPKNALGQKGTYSYDLVCSRVLNRNTLSFIEYVNGKNCSHRV